MECLAVCFSDIAHGQYSNTLYSAPYIVILKDRGQTLRFYSVQSLRLRNGAFREFLLADGWLTSHPWSSAYAPGGERFESSA